MTMTMTNDFRFPFGVGNIANLPSPTRSSTPWPWPWPINPMTPATTRTPQGPPRVKKDTPPSRQTQRLYVCMYYAVVVLKQIVLHILYSIWTLKSVQCAQTSSQSYNIILYGTDFKAHILPVWWASGVKYFPVFNSGLHPSLNTGKYFTSLAHYTETILYCIVLQYCMYYTI